MTKTTTKTTLKTLEKHDKGYYVDWQYSRSLYYQTEEEAEKRRLALLRERERNFDNKQKNNT